MGQQTLAGGENLCLGASQQGESGNITLRCVAVAIEPQRGLQGCQGQLVQAQGALQGVTLDGIDSFTSANQNAGLRAAQQFVAAEGNDIGASGDGVAWLGFVGQA